MKKSKLSGKTIKPYPYVYIEAKGKEIVIPIDKEPFYFHVKVGSQNGAMGYITSLHFVYNDSAVNQLVRK